MGAVAFTKYLADQREKDLLRFITCGSVDDGKSTLIGRLLHDSGSVAEDIVAAARADSARWGTQGSELDLALLVDGLQSEREQGITIDVAHRYFDTPRRKFILADTPGHEQYTRNMATGASEADLAILLVDAAKGLQPQTRRHAYIVRLLGIRHVIVATNKMDAIGYDRARYEALERDARDAFEQLGFERLEFIPVSALRGDFVVRRSDAMAWYTGPTLLEALEAAPTERAHPSELRLPVQYVSRPDATFRGYAGTLTGGSIAIGDSVVALPSGARSVVTSVSGASGPQQSASTGESVMITLADQIDLGRGQVLASPAQPPVVTKRFVADLVWMGADALIAGHAYEFKFAHRYVPGTIGGIEHRVDVHDYSTQPAGTLALNDVGRVDVELAEAVALDLYDEHETTGSFIVIDRDTNATVGAGLVRRTSVGRLVAAATPITRERRAAQKRQKPLVLWFTGLSGAGKSTIAAALEQALVARGHHTYLLDGDRVRQGLNRDLGFGELDRRENLRRIGEVARVLADAGLIVIVACISPLRADRARARELLGEDFVEVFVDASLAVCEARDPKGHYRRARSGALRDFTGVDAPYEAPETPELRLDTVSLDVDGAVEATLGFLAKSGRLRADGTESDWAI